MLGRKETRNEETISFVRGLLEGEYKQKNGEKEGRKERNGQIIIYLRP